MTPWGSERAWHAMNPDLLVAVLAWQDFALETPGALSRVPQQERGKTNVNSRFRELAAFGGQEMRECLAVLVDQRR
jgi:hypothetical protein